MTLRRILHFVCHGAAARRVVVPLLALRRHPAPVPYKVTVPAPLPTQPAEGPRRGFFGMPCLT